MNIPYRIIFVSMLLVTCLQVSGQHFPKSKCYPWLWIEAGQGFNQFKAEAKLYLATLQIVPQYTIIEGHLRGGAVVGAFYQGDKIGFLGGPRLTYKLLQGKQTLTAYSFNIHVLGEYLFGSATGADRRREWLGGGFGLEIDDFVSLSIKVHRDLQQPITYAQLGLAFHLTKSRPPVIPPVN